MLVQVVLLKSLFLVCSAWRKLKTCRKKFCKEGATRTGWRFWSVLFSKILPVPCGTFSPYIESEKGRTLKSFKKVDISVVLEIFVYPQKGTLPSLKRDTQNNNKKRT
ncbi:hypothetical protein COK81_11770 [Bacillus thuringiensis]|uniref:Uncharacterized protein n=1 Tax=Bacillus thuringiensis TaxID=1428 RepID=A0A9X7G272_BACTU|nr:hypothetical protein COK81_11770 [Bacillus thuringiensis]